MKPALYIIAFKHIQYHTRIHKEAVILKNIGFDVHIICLGKEENNERKNNEFETHQIVLKKSILGRTNAKITNLFKEKKEDAIVHSSVGIENKSHTKKAITFNKIFYKTLRFIYGIFENTVKRISNIVPKRLIKTLLIAEFTIRCRQFIIPSKSTVLFAHDLYALPAAWWYAKRYHCRFIYDAVEYSPDRNRQIKPGKISQFIISKVEGLSKNASVVFAAWPYLKEYLQKRYRLENVHILLNCPSFEPEPMSSLLEQKVGKNPNEFILLYVGLISGGRGIETLIQSIDHLDDRIKVVLIGPVAPNFKDRLENILKSLTLDFKKRISVLEPISPNEIINVASSADIGIIPIENNCLNHEYCLPNKLFEYIMAGLPIVCTDLKGIGRYVQNNQLGCVFEELSAEKLATAVNDLVKDEVEFNEIKKRVTLEAQKRCWENESRPFYDLMKEMYNHSVTA